MAHLNFVTKNVHTLFNHNSIKQLQKCKKEFSACSGVVQAQSKYKVQFRYSPITAQAQGAIQAQGAVQAQSKKRMAI